MFLRAKKSDQNGLQQIECSQKSEVTISPQNNLVCPEAIQRQ